MKLYHVDRSGHINSGDEIKLVKDFYNEDNKNVYYEDGLSSHGLYYYLRSSNCNDFLIDAIFEYERILNYPEKLSRYQAFYLFDKEGVKSFIEEFNLKYKYYRVFEVEVKEYQKHDMNLLRGVSHNTISKYAKMYWENLKDPNPKSTPLYEYLVKLPIKIGKEVNIKDL